MIGRLPLDEQLTALKSVLSRNEVLLEVLHRAAALDLPGWYLTAGCLFQTVWNVVTDRPPTKGIKDYDLFYFDDGDLSWEAEDEVIKAARKATVGDVSTRRMDSLTCSTSSYAPIRYSPLGRSTRPKQPVGNNSGRN